MNTSIPLDDVGGEKAKHTPGPWTLVSYPNDEYPAPHEGDRRIVGANKICIGILFGGYRSLPELEANFPIVTAAPELADTLVASQDRVRVLEEALRQVEARANSLQNADSHSECLRQFACIDLIVRRAALTATSSPDAGGWQPIETAPQQKLILLFAVSDVAEDGRVRNWKMETGCRHAFGDGTIWEWNGRFLNLYDIQPTHWRPLPDPPSPTAQTARREG